MNKSCVLCRIAHAANPLLKISARGIKHAGSIEPVVEAVVSKTLIKKIHIIVVEVIEKGISSNSTESVDNEGIVLIEGNSLNEIISSDSDESAPSARFRLTGEKGEKQYNHNWYR